MVDFRARPPKGFFFQPQGSVSPFTFELRISLMLSFEEKFPNIDEKQIKKTIILYFFII